MIFVMASVTAFVKALLMTSIMVMTYVVTSFIPYRRM